MSIKTGGDILGKHLLLQVDYRGRAIKAMEGTRALLRLWALQNTTGKGKTYIADSTGKVTSLYIGQGKGSFPKILDAEQIEAQLGEIYITERKGKGA